MKRKKLICGLIIFLLATTTVSLVLFLNKTKVEIENKVKKNDLALVALKEQILQEMLSIYYIVRGKDLSRFYVNDTFLNENAYIAHGGG